MMPDTGCARTEEAIPDFAVRRWARSDAASVWAVIDAVWAEFDIAVRAADVPDLADIPQAYGDGRSGFWVAEDAGRIVGTIALKAIGGGGYTLKRMYVLPAWRGTQTARLLLAAAIGCARDCGGGAIYLGTVEEAVASQRFYEKHGFARVDPVDLPTGFFRSPEDTRFYRLALAASAR